LNLERKLAIIANLCGLPDELLMTWLIAVLSQKSSQ